jgi:hypothetical protein
MEQGMSIDWTVVTGQLVRGLVDILVGGAVGYFGFLYWKKRFAREVQERTADRESERIRAALLQGIDDPKKALRRIHDTRKVFSVWENMPEDKPFLETVLDDEYDESGEPIDMRALAWALAIAEHCLESASDAHATTGDQGSVS